MSKSIAPTAGLAATGPGYDYRAMTVAALAAITAARLVWLAVQPADLYPDEAQYWFWAQHPALGYYSKPPLVAWLIALTTRLFGDGEFAIRVSAPVLHALAGGLVFGIGRRLYGARTGFWSALAYASLPGVSVSSFLMSTDAVLMPCWAAALYAFVRARGSGEGRWWVAVGIAGGVGLLAKYAMAYWLISALLYVSLVRAERRLLRPLLAAAGLAVLIYLPNLWWNWSHGFVSYLHVRDNAAIAGPVLHPVEFVEFLGSQFGVFGPLFFPALMVIAASRRLLADPRARMLAAFALPTLAMMLVVSFLSRAQPNWAAPTYVSATVLVVAVILETGWSRAVAVSILLNAALAVMLFGGREALAAAGVELPAQYDPLHRLRGWRSLGQEVSVVLAAHPGLTLLADDRELLAALIYYVRPHPFDAAIWSPLPGIKDQWALDNNLANHRGESFLAVTEHGLVDYMRGSFVEVTPLTTITIATGPEGGRTYALYLARDLLGAPGQR